MVVVTILLAVGACGRASAQNLYFLSGTTDEFRTYSAEIYRASQGKPVRVREVIHGRPGNDLTLNDPGLALIADDPAGQIVFARPTGAGPTLSIVHEDRPALADDLVEPAPWSASETAVVRPPSGTALLLMKITGHRKDEINLVGLKAPSKTRRVVPGNMSD
jgi:hypothetical protein